MNKKQWVNRHKHPGFLKNALAIRGSVTPKVFKKVLFMVGYSFVFTPCINTHPTWVEGLVKMIKRQGVED